MGKLRWLLTRLWDVWCWAQGTCRHILVLRGCGWFGRPGEDFSAQHPCIQERRAWAGEGKTQASCPLGELIKVASVAEGSLAQPWQEQTFPSPLWTWFEANPLDSLVLPNVV